MIGSDDGGHAVYAFLVPDEGCEAISNLHSRLYTGPLERFCRVDIPYTPHITLGRSTSERDLEGLCDELDSRRLEIHGRIEVLTVGTMENGRFSNLASARMAALPSTAGGSARSVE